MCSPAFADSCEDIGTPLENILTLKHCVTDLQDQINSMRNELDVQYDYIKNLDEETFMLEINESYTNCGMFNAIVKEIVALKGMKNYKERDCDMEKSIVMRIHDKK